MFTTISGSSVFAKQDSTASALNHIKDGRIKALAVTTSRPAPPPLDKIPLIAATIPGFNAAGWSGLAAPARTPLEIVAKVSRDMQALLNDDAVVKLIEQRAALPAPGTPTRATLAQRFSERRWSALMIGSAITCPPQRVPDGRSAWQA